jgi:LPS export ABC transporter protein LptC
MNIKKYLNMLLEPVLGYTRVVFATKYLLLMVAALLILALIILPLLNNVQDNFRISFSNVEGVPGTKESKMINPRFQGVDKDNQTYTVTAASATKLKDETLVLNEINSNMDLKDGSRIEMQATSGKVNHANKSLELFDKVHINTNDGYEADTSYVFVNLENKSAHSDKPLEARTEFAILNADTFEVTENGNRIFFKGHVKIKFDQAAYEESKKRR